MWSLIAYQKVPRPGDFDRGTRRCASLIAITLDKNEKRPLRLYELDRCFCAENATPARWRQSRSAVMEPDVLIACLSSVAIGDTSMPVTIIILLTAAPLLTLSMMHGTVWPPEILVLGQLALAAAVVTLVLWVVVDVILALSQSWSRFITRPY